MVWLGRVSGFQVEFFAIMKDKTGSPVITVDWEAQFRAIFRKAVDRYKSGAHSADAMFQPDELSFLASVGCSAQELFDFVEDRVRYTDVTEDLVVRIAAVRRNYFLSEQHGKASAVRVRMSDLPSKQAAVDGIEWLPRLIVKARAKLRGEMPPELMYGCAGDRPFAVRMNIDLAEFLRVVWDAGNRDASAIEYVKKQAARRRPA